MTAVFLINSVLFGVGLAMDAFSVSLANGMSFPEMGKKRACLIAGVFCVFQFIMPLIGWIFVHTLAETFTSFQRYIPWIALILLLYVGGKMLKEGIEESREMAASQNADTKDQAPGQSTENMISEEVIREVSEAVKPDAISPDIRLTTLLIQGIATSIDALSVGFTIADYNFIQAAAEALIIGLVTFIICIAGVGLGKKIGMKLAGKASILGGIILIAIGIEIFLKG